MAVPRGVDLWNRGAPAYLDRIPPGHEAATATTLELWVRFDPALVQKLDHGVILAEDPSGLVRLWFWPTNTTGQDTFAMRVMVVGGPSIVAEGPRMGTLSPPADGEVPEEATGAGGMYAFNPAVEPTTFWWQSSRACVAATTPAVTVAPPLAFVEYHPRAPSSFERYMRRTLGDCRAIGTMAPGIEVRAARATPYARSGLQILTTMGTAEAGFRPIDQAAERAAVARLAWTADSSRAPAAHIPTPLVRVPSRTGFYIAGVMVLGLVFLVWPGPPS